jgi:hypothetical protein
MSLQRSLEGFVAAEVMHCFPSMDCLVVIIFHHSLLRKLVDI